MKKILLQLFLLASVPVVTRAQEPFIKDIDNSARGTAVNQFNFSGSGWVHATNTTDPYFNQTVSYSNQTANTVTFSFVGNQIKLFSAKASHHGIMAISLDNGPEVTVDLYAATRQNFVIAYSAGAFSPVTGATIPEGNHTIKIRVTGTKNPSSSGTYAMVDYVTIYSSKSNTTMGTGANAYGSGYHNTAYGAQALMDNVFGAGANTAIGSNALKANNRGANNTAVGYNALVKHWENGGNTAVGVNALAKDTWGVENTAVGSEALSEANTWWNTGVGVRALQYSRGNWNTAIGASAGMAQGTTTIENSTAVGYSATVTSSNQVRLGNAYVTSIGGQVSWSTLSDGRFKKDIKEDVSGLEFIKKLRPVSYTVDKEALEKFLRIPDSVRAINAASRKKIVRETGFVAQEVETLVKKTGYVFNGVEKPENEGDHYSIRYAEFVVPLVKAMQELAEKVDAQEKVAETQQKKIEVLTEQLKKYGVNTDEVLSTDDVELFQNNPNPFTRDTEITMTLPESALNAKVIVYNMEGKQLKDLLVRERGNTSVKISGSELSEGMYLYALIVDGKVVDTKRMILTK
jgi:trimeric autotransporter adhesin